MTSDKNTGFRIRHRALSLALPLVMAFPFVLDTCVQAQRSVATLVVATLQQGDGPGKYQITEDFGVGQFGELHRNIFGQIILADESQGIHLYEPTANSWRIIARNIKASPVLLLKHDLLVFRDKSRNLTTYSLNGTKKQEITLPGNYRVWGMVEVSSDRVLLLCSPPFEGAIDTLRVVSLKDGRTLGHRAVEWSILNTVVRGGDGRYYWHGDTSFSVPALGTLHGVPIPRKPVRVERSQLTLLAVREQVIVAMEQLSDTDVRIARVSRSGRLLNYTRLDRLFANRALPSNFKDQRSICADREGNVYCLVEDDTRAQILRLQW